MTDNNADVPPHPAVRDDQHNALREEGLPLNGLILIPPVAATPMRQPDTAWAMLVLALDILGEVDPDRADDIALFAGCWLARKPPPDLHDGDLVLILTSPSNASTSAASRVDVTMLLACQGRWQQVDVRYGLDAQWPAAIAHTTAAVMRLYTATTETTDQPVTVPSAATGGLDRRKGNSALSDLLAAGLVTCADEFIWYRPGRGARHTARIQADGTLRLADGRVYAHPSGATTALGGRHQNGWPTWRRISDGRALSDLRAELHRR